MVRVNLGILLVLSVFALFGSFFSTLLMHEIIHAYQSKDVISLSYDLLQPTFSHVLHDISSWESNLAFREFVVLTESSADLMEGFVEYFFNFLIGSCAFALVFKRVDTPNK